jgi:molybdate transport system substrate-binding protein
MAEITVYSSIGVRSAAEQLFRKFEKENSCPLAVTWGTAPMLVARIEAGETADVLILSRAGIDALQKRGKVAASSDVMLAGSGVAIAVKAGAAKPDIPTP